MRTFWGIEGSSWVKYEEKGSEEMSAKDSFVGS